MRPAAPMGSQSPLDDRAQIAGRLDWIAPPRLDDHSRDPPRPALLAVRIDDACEFLGALLVHDVARAQGLPVIHSHIQRTIESERKPALRIVERVAAHT